ncbi:translation initiation factor [Pedobacter sp. JY14-1]|uniref:translation initiation factor n=1 Tax=Pedobacter sp. JY14-1 TaxID=3034151 RepID=UPI0023E219DE|nr:translation initiation factor [Pedobacter sp. JY14-1]
MKKDKKKVLNDFGGIMYSTDPSYVFEEAADGTESDVPNGQQDLRVMLDKKNRGGKAVTLVTGFRGPDLALAELAKLLKSKCGVGGSAKDGSVLIQGDFRDKIMEILVKEGYKAKRSGG